MYVVCPDVDSRAVSRGILTVGKVYRAISNTDKLGFYIYTNGGERIYCLHKNCAYLAGGNWVKLTSNLTLDFKYIIDRIGIENYPMFINSFIHVFGE